MKQQCKNHQGLVLLYRIYSGSGSPSPLPRLVCFTTVQCQSPLPELALTIDPPPLLDFCASSELRDMVGIAVGPFPLSSLPCARDFKILLCCRGCLEGSYGWAMVPAYRPSVFASASVGEWVWADFSEPAKVQFVLHNR